MIALFKLAGMPKVTKPLPERMAACAHKTAEPENRPEPAKIKICPKSPLWALGFLGNNRVGNRISFYMRNGDIHVYFFALAV